MAKYAINNILLLILLSNIYKTINTNSNNEYNNNNYNFSLVKRIHQTWRGKYLPNFYSRNVNSWRKCFPTWNYKLWTDEENRDLVKTHYSWLLKFYDSFSKGIYRSDLIRYLYMHKYGGIYTDLDNECLKPFDFLLADQLLVFSSTADNYHVGTNDYIQNSFMYSQPNNSLWLDVIKRILLSDHAGADAMTGPDALCWSIMFYKYKFRNTRNRRIQIYPYKYFNPLSYYKKHKNPAHCKPFKMIHYDWIICRLSLKKLGSYVAQYHAHNW